MTAAWPEGWERIICPCGDTIGGRRKDDRAHIHIRHGCGAVTVIHADLPAGTYHGGGLLPPDPGPLMPIDPGPAPYMITERQARKLVDRTYDVLARINAGHLNDEGSR